MKHGVDICHRIRISYGMLMWILRSSGARRIVADGLVTDDVDVTMVCQIVKKSKV